MKYVVTGGSGFIGAHLVKALSQKGEVTNIDLLPSAQDSAASRDVIGDISNTDNNLKFLEALQGAECVFHLAAKARVQPSIEHPIEFDQTNVKGTLNMLELSREAGVKNFIFTSSSSLYGNTHIYPTPETLAPNPLSPYGLQKLIGEQYCQLYSRIHDMNTACLRYFNVYGENAPTEGAYCLVIGKFIQQALAGKNLTIFGDGQQKRDFTYVQDVVQANILAAEKVEGMQGEAFNIGNGDNRSVQEIADVFGLPCDYLPERLEPKETLADNSKAKNLLGWKPTGDVVDWLKNYLTIVLNK
tara:strand:+ start:1014 stop:1913 length:900 start_codon:yes stop_codon:yes gene_type:complete